MQTIDFGHLVARGRLAACLVTAGLALTGALAGCGGDGGGNDSFGVPNDPVTPPVVENPQPVAVVTGTYVASLNGLTMTLDLSERADGTVTGQAVITGAPFPLPAFPVTGTHEGGDVHLEIAVPPAVAALSNGLVEEVVAFDGIFDPDLEALIGDVTGVSPPLMDVTVPRS